MPKKGDDLDAAGYAAVEDHLYLDVVQITLRLNNLRGQLPKEFSKWARYIQTIPADSMKKYQLHEGFKNLSVFDFKPVKAQPLENLMAT